MAKKTASKKTTEAKASKPKSTAKKTASKTKTASKPKAKSSKKILAGDQPQINIGLVGHVDHGKTTLVKALSGKWTDVHSEEIKRGITIRLGYADATFYKDTSLPDPDCYTIFPSNDAGKANEKVRTVSFVDAPGHESLMATMLAGSTIMDGALLLVSATEECPQPQTREHLKALEIVGIDKVIVVQNKIDTVKEEVAQKNYEQIKAFLKGTKFENAPVIPISAMHRINIDVLINTIEEVIPTPDRDAKADAVFFCARSFDINKPGSDPVNIKGGILGGSVKQGTFKIGDTLEILPGYEREEKNKKVWYPLKTEVVGLMTGGAPAESIGPGGSVAILTTLDPSIIKSDKLTGAVVGQEGKLPKVWYEIALEAHLLERVVGTKDELTIDPLRKGELLMLNVNSAATVGVVSEVSKGIATCSLKRPVCAEPGARVTISRRVGNRFRLIGYGILKEKK